MQLYNACSNFNIPIPERAKGRPTQDVEELRELLREYLVNDLFI